MNANFGENNPANTCYGSVGVKSTVLVAVPIGVVTSIGPVVAPSGTIATISVDRYF
jgi:hypothetical protein